MADKTIADFTQITTLSKTDVALVSSAGTTFKATIEQFRGTINEYPSKSLPPAILDTLLISSGGIKYSTSVQALRGVVRVEINNVESLPQTVEAATISDDMVVFGYRLSDPFALSSDLAVTTYDGSVRVAGTLKTGGTTSIILYLGRF